MFFWTLMASLLGIIMFGHWRDNSKDQADFVAPVYQAMVLSTYQQHLAAEQAYLSTMSTNPSATIDKWKNAPWAGTERVNMMADDSPFGRINSGDDSPYTPKEYSFKSDTRTYLFCLSRTNQVLGECFDDTGDSDTVKYLFTVRPVPAKYQGTGKMSILRSIADATNGSRSVGLLMKYDNATGLQAGGGTRYQPLGAQYYILSGGTSLAGNVFIPNSVICHFPLDDAETTLLKDKLNQNDLNYIVALSMLGGFGGAENLPAGDWAACCADGD